MCATIIILAMRLVSYDKTTVLVVLDIIIGILASIGLIVNNMHIPTMHDDGTYDKNAGGRQ